MKVTSLFISYEYMARDENSPGRPQRGRGGTEGEGEGRQPFNGGGGHWERAPGCTQVRTGDRERGRATTRKSGQQIARRIWSDEKGIVLVDIVQLFYTSCTQLAAPEAFKPLFRVTCLQVVAVLG